MFTNKKEKEKTIDYSKNTTVGSENKENGFIPLLEKEEKYTGDDTGNKKSDIMEYFRKIREIIDKIYTIDKSIEGYIKK
ncbi:MAG: hypothetical protein PHH16_02975 [Candidatus Gracilibacteria bacterium]|nr:hypothetical protein [Candidatus Gracilibacteria bacterium]